MKNALIFLMIVLTLPMLLFTVGKKATLLFVPFKGLTKKFIRLLIMIAVGVGIYLYFFR